MGMNRNRPTSSCWFSRKCLLVLVVSFPSQMDCSGSESRGLFFSTLFLIKK